MGIAEEIGEFAAGVALAIVRAIQAGNTSAVESLAPVLDTPELIEMHARAIETAELARAERVLRGE